MVQQPVNVGGDFVLGLNRDQSRICALSVRDCNVYVCLLLFWDECVLLMSKCLGEISVPGRLLFI